MLAAILLFSSFSLSTVISEEEKKIDSNQPLILTVSPKIWNLLETRANFVNGGVTEITFPEFSGKVGLQPVKAKLAVAGMLSLGKSLFATPTYSLP
ncbi:hypothetical protein RB195_019768 [Necator americanus]|uniref:Uncharacterized protein n=1 Tax=Necator americanus TaxID=51031 RepID=A0ABR1CFP2_NECAM